MDFPPEARPRRVVRREDLGPFPVAAQAAVHVTGHVTDQVAGQASGQVSGHASGHEERTALSPAAGETRADSAAVPTALDGGPLAFDAAAPPANRVDERPASTDSPQTALLDCTVPAALEYAASIRDEVARLGRLAGCQQQGIDELRLAVNEAFVNAVRHGSCDGRPDRIRAGAAVRIRVLRAGASIIIEVEDSGSGFRPESIVLPPDELSPNGRGIFFMKLVMDQVDFLFHGGTLVRMTKHLWGPSGVSAGS